MVSMETLDAGALLGALQPRLEQERAELARRLHGELGSLLTAVRMSISAMGSDRQVDPALRAELSRQLALAQGIQQQLVEALRPGLLDHFGIGAALSARCQQRCGEVGVSLAWQASPDLRRLPPEASILLYRVGDAALGVLLGGKPQSLGVSLSAADDQLRLALASVGATDECSFGPELAALAFWADRLGGRLACRSERAAGFVEVTLPMGSEP
jgi:signal transduction histidine kinase